MSGADASEDFLMQSALPAGNPFQLAAVAAPKPGTRILPLSRLEMLPDYKSDSDNDDLVNISTNLQVLFRTNFDSCYTHTLLLDIFFLS